MSLLATYVGTLSRGGISRPVLRTSTACLMDELFEYKLHQQGGVTLESQTVNTLEDILSHKYTSFSIIVVNITAVYD